jgi:fibrillarin-like rRNA methylase
MRNTMSYIRLSKPDVQSKTKMAATAILNFTYYAANSLLSTGFSPNFASIYFTERLIRKNEKRQWKWKKSKMATAAILNSSVNYPSVNY